MGRVGRETSSPVLTYEKQFDDSGSYQKVTTTPDRYGNRQAAMKNR